MAFWIDGWLDGWMVGWLDGWMVGILNYLNSSQPQIHYSSLNQLEYFT